MRLPPLVDFQIWFALKNQAIRQAKSTRYGRVGGKSVTVYQSILVIWRAKKG